MNIGNGRPMPPQQVGLQVAQPLNDLQLVCLVAGSVVKQDVQGAVEMALEIVEYTIRRMGTQEWERRVQAARAMSKQDDEDAEMRRRGAMGAVNIELP